MLPKKWFLVLLFLCVYSWLNREYVLERIKVKAESIMKDFEGQPGLILPEGFSLHAYYEEIRMEKPKSLFPLIVRLETREKNVDIAKMRKYDLIQMAAQRVIYRYILFYLFIAYV